MLDSLDISVSPDLRSVRRFLKAVEDDVIADAEVDAYNKLILQVRTRARRVISQQLKIPQRLVNARAKLNRATRRFPAARYALGVLYHLPARYLNPTQLKAGVKYRRQSGQRRTRPGSFIVPARSLRNLRAGQEAYDQRRRFVFERAGRDRLPIRQIGVQIERLVLIAFAKASREILPKAGELYAKQFEFRAQRAADKFLRRRAPRRRR